MSRDGFGRFFAVTLVVGAVLLVSATGASAAQIFSATGAIQASDPTQTPRLFRDNVVDTCADPNDAESVTSTGNFHYDLYTFTNRTNETLCITVNLDAMTCTGAQFIYSGAYVPTFDPASIVTNAVASAGSSPNPTGSYSFTVPPGNFAVNVHETTANALCPAYGITLDSLQPFATGVPAISGDATVGRTLTGSNGTWSGNPTFAYQWRRCDALGGSCADIPGATGATYVLTAADEGSTLRLRVSATEAGQSSTADSAPSSVVAPAATAECQGATVTKLEGTDGDDTLVGTPNPDAIFGLGGNDDVDGVDGNDCLDGGDGDDILRGGADNDLELGGEGSDKVRGQGGKDKLKGGEGKDRLNGGEGKDTLVGGPGKDKLNGSAAKDKLKGNAAADDINAVDAKTDRVNCGGGDDKAVVDPIDKVSRNCETVREVVKD